MLEEENVLYQGNTVMANTRPVPVKNLNIRVQTRMPISLSTLALIPNQG